MRLARCTVAKRCAMTSVVRFCMIRPSARWTAASLSASSALVASSRSRIGASREHRARKRDALALSARQRHPALAEPSCIALRECCNERVGLRSGGCSLHVRVAGFGPAVADVLQDRVVEQRDLLRHQRDARSKRLRIDICNREAVDGYAAQLRIVETQDQIEDRALAGARRTRPAPPSRPRATAKLTPLSADTPGLAG